MASYQPKSALAMNDPALYLAKVNATGAASTPAIRT